jgi:hypothetical protein
MLQQAARTIVWPIVWPGRWSGLQVDVSNGSSCPSAAAVCPDTQICLCLNTPVGPLALPRAAAWAILQHAELAQQCRKLLLAVAAARLASLGLALHQVGKALRSEGAGVQASSQNVCQAGVGACWC